jgi:hypothetical protein
MLFSFSISDFNFFISSNKITDSKEYLMLAGLPSSSFGINMLKYSLTSSAIRPTCLSFGCP